MSDAAIPSDRGLLLAGEESAGPVVIEVPGGSACLATMRGPDKSGPNEDCATAIHAGGRAVVLAVADGCGGLPLGDGASKSTMAALWRCVTARPEGAGRSEILDAFEEANAELVTAGLGSATTLSVALLEGNVVRPFHAGDTAVLVVGQRGRVKLATLSHAPVAYAVEAGLLDENEALHHDDRWAISNLVGSQDMRIEVGAPLALARRDTVLLASDGLTDNLTTGEIVDRVRCGPLDAAAGSLLALARSRMCEPEPGQPSKPDDCSLVLFRRD